MRIVNTLSVGLVWMVINTTLGIKNEYAFIQDKVTRGNIIFYAWFIISLVAFLWWVIRLWSKPIHFEE